MEIIPPPENKPDHILWDIYSRHPCCGGSPADVWKSIISVLACHDGFIRSCVWNQCLPIPVGWGWGLHCKCPELPCACRGGNWMKVERHVGERLEGEKAHITWGDDWGWCTHEAMLDIQRSCHLFDGCRVVRVESDSSLEELQWLQDVSLLPLDETCRGGQHTLTHTHTHTLTHLIHKWHIRTSLQSPAAALLSKPVETVEQ